MTDTTDTATTDPRAIGVFDSGLGGMTVARAVRHALPDEAICYVGDTARVPYGTKSPETVRLYARQNIAFLLEQGVKAIVAACNTVSAVALPDIEGDYDVPLLGVVEMGVGAALARRRRRIGVIGTETTIHSGAYARAIAHRAPGVDVLERATPLFVPLIEEGWHDHAVTRDVIAEYLGDMRAAGIDALILGCTHYPLIRPALGDFFGQSVEIVDSAQAMAQALVEAIDAGRLLPAPASGAASRFLVTDRCNHFQSLVGAFMGDDALEVEQISVEMLTQAI